MSEPDTRLESVEQEARTCPVCGTKFFATSDSGFCPVCILRGATGGESATTREPGSVSGLAGAKTENVDGGSRVRRFENYGHHQQLCNIRRYVGPKTIHAAHPIKTRPAAGLTNRLDGGIFSARTRMLMLATHNRFITPKANRRPISAQQQPRQ